VTAEIQVVLDDLDADRLPRLLKRSQFTERTTGVELESIAFRSRRCHTGMPTSWVRYRGPRAPPLKPRCDDFAGGFALAGAHRAVVSSPGLEWSTDGTQWQRAVTGVYGVVSSRGYWHLDVEKLALVQELMDAGRAEPSRMNCCVRPRTSGIRPHEVAMSLLSRRLSYAICSTASGTCAACSMRTRARNGLGHLSLKQGEGANRRDEQGELIGPT